MTQSTDSGGGAVLQGRHFIVRGLGTGGTSAVYLARDVVVEVPHTEE